MIKGRNQVYFFDRDNCCFKVEGIIFPQGRDLNLHLENTVLDGVNKIQLHPISKIFYWILIFKGNGY